MPLRMRVLDDLLLDCFLLTWQPNREQRGRRDDEGRAIEGERGGGSRHKDEACADQWTDEQAELSAEFGESVRRGERLTRHEQRRHRAIRWKEEGAHDAKDRAEDN